MFGVLCGSLAVAAGTFIARVGTADIADAQASVVSKKMGSTSIAPSPSRYAPFARAIIATETTLDWQAPVYVGGGSSVHAAIPIGGGLREAQTTRFGPLLLSNVTELMGLPFHPSDALHGEARNIPAHALTREVQLLVPRNDATDAFLARAPPPPTTTGTFRLHVTPCLPVVYTCRGAASDCPETLVRNVSRAQFGVAWALILGGGAVAVASVALLCSQEDDDELRRGRRRGW